MHDLHMIHTDLKPENILLVSSDYLKIPDYKVLLYEPVLFSHVFRDSMLMLRENVYLLYHLWPDASLHNKVAKWIDG
jgi:serine/threonine protein kinase